MSPLPRTVLALLGALAGACGPWQQPGTEAAPDAAAVVPRLFDTATLYEGMGLFAGGPPIGFVAGIRFLAGPMPDSSLAIVGISLANHALSFRRTGAEFEASYRVDVTFRTGGAILGQFSSDETVRVAGFQETLRSDESVIFQRFLTVPPESATVTVAVRDRHSGAFSRAERHLVIPRFAEQGAIAWAVPVYQVTPRDRRDQLPELVVNPRATAPYGTDTLQLYLEGYGVQQSTVTLRVLLRQSGAEVWRDSTVLDAAPTGVAGTAVRIPPALLPVGELLVEVWQPEGDTLRTSVLVSFSDQWAVANFEETLSLLRYFGHDAVLRQLADAPAEERAERWQAFWKETDPNPLTPEHEALNEYFARMRAANEQFREVGIPGWITDRGEVFVTLGEPDEIFESGADLQGRQRVIRWTYFAHRLAVDFVDETGFGRFRLAPGSRQEFLTVVNRLRRDA